MHDQDINQAELARRLGVTRARVTQILQLLDVAPHVLGAVAALGEQQSKQVVAERLLRSLIRLPSSEQEHRINEVLASKPRAR